MRIGVDVGGTNTDAVVMDGSAVVASVKLPTTADVSSGIVAAIRQVLKDSKADPKSMTGVMIGTTHFTNAFVEQKRLLRVGIIRIALPATKCLPPQIDWPAGLKKAVGENSYLVGGGYEFDGREIAPLDEMAVAEAARHMKSKGLRAVAISCVFAPINDTMEERAAEIVCNELPGADITLSKDIGRIGLLERENAAIMNASLGDLAIDVVGSFRSALESLHIKAPLFISQNDGTLMSADYAERFPVLTFASGPTNSMRGAAFLSGLEDAVVVDIGGTTTDVGVLSKGFPRESSVSVDIGGVRTNFRMPDVLSVGLGGGSLVRQNNGVSVGPDSVGYQLTQKALVFGGDTLTASDIAVAAGTAEMGDHGKAAHLDSDFVGRALDAIHDKVDEAVDRMKISATPVPVVLVGGGGVLVSRPIKGASEVLTPDHASVANAVGAAIAHAGGEVDRVYAYDSVGRETAIEQASEEAGDKAVAAGADPGSVRIIEVEELPLAYMPGGMVRLRVKAVGDRDGGVTA